MAVSSEKNEQPDGGHHHEGAESNHRKIEHGHAMLLLFVSPLGVASEGAANC